MNKKIVLCFTIIVAQAAYSSGQLENLNRAVEQVQGLAGNLKRVQDSNTNINNQRAGEHYLRFLGSFDGSDESAASDSLRWGLSVPIMVHLSVAFDDSSNAALRGKFNELGKGIDRALGATDELDKNLRICREDRAAAEDAVRGRRCNLLLRVLGLGCCIRKPREKAD
jgi:hypothetical protein